MSREKIVTPDALAKIAAQERTAGRNVVLAHGVFDLMHLGHIRHLQEARSCGDTLIVTLTTDRYVNKGPGRPVFSEQMRAEMIAALEFVDWVAINDAPTATPLLCALKPAVYVKGVEYAEAADDVTGGILEEREAVEAGGGRIHFTDDITFSSSSLINQHLGIYDEELRGYLDRIRTAGLRDDLVSLINRIGNFHVVLVGDTIIDEYQYVEPLGKSPKENMIATRVRGRELFAGGVIAAANHVAGFCETVEVVTCLGQDESFEELVRQSLKPNVILHVVPIAGRPTVRKCRFIENGYLRKLFEVYHFDETPIHGEEEAALDHMVRQVASSADVVIATDFGHGMITPRIVTALEDSAKFLAVNTQTNSANHGYNLITRYARADYICIDAMEARLAMADKFSDMSDMIVEKLVKRVDCPQLIVTRGKFGCTTYSRTTGLHDIPSFTKTVVDTVGAGDAFLSVTSPLVAAGGRMDQVGFIGNAAGAMKVGIVGHRRSVEKVPLVKYITALLK